MPLTMILMVIMMNMMLSIWYMIDSSLVVRFVYCRINISGTKT